MEHVFPISGLFFVNVCCHSCFLPFVNYRADIDEFQAYNSVPNFLLNFPVVIFQNLKDFLLLCPSAFIAMSRPNFDISYIILMNSAFLSYLVDFVTPEISYNSSVS